MEKDTSSNISSAPEQRHVKGLPGIIIERTPMAWWGHGIFLIVAIIGIRSAFVLHQFITLTITCLVWLLCTTLKVVVSPSDVRIRLGPFGPNIPHQNIDSVEVINRSAFPMGWGIRFRFMGSITYSVPASTRQYLRIVYRTGSRHRTIDVMTFEPNRLIRGIKDAKSRLEGQKINRLDH
jgi:hypothetical protein